MALAWKVMLPLGLVNVVVVAVWIEYGDRLAALTGLPEAGIMAAVGWVVLIASWLVVTVCAATNFDNRPLRGPETSGHQAEGATSP